MKTNWPITALTFCHASSQPPFTALLAQSWKWTQKKIWTIRADSRTVHYLSFAKQLTRWNLDEPTVFHFTKGFWTVRIIKGQRMQLWWLRTVAIPCHLGRGISSSGQENLLAKTLSTVGNYTIITLTVCGDLSLSPIPGWLSFISSLPVTCVKARAMSETLVGIWIVPSLC